MPASKPASKKLFVFLLLTTVILGITNVYLFVDRYVTAKNEAIRKENERKAILEGMSAVPTQVTVDLSKKTVIGSPLIFGGVHTPVLNQIDAWEKLQKIGATLIRRDLYVEWMFQPGINLSNYFGNTNEMLITKKLSQKNIDSVKDYYQMVEKRGMKVMGILCYAPSWLTYSGTIFGVPKDWNVYEDVVANAYKLYRNDIDYLEIWNEPDHSRFLDLKNSPYTREDAYELILTHALKAIKSVDSQSNDQKKILVGAPAISNSANTAILRRILANKYISENLDFVSLHNYGLKEPSWLEFKAVLDENKKGKLPIYITEWNAAGTDATYNELFTTELAIPYTADKLTDYFKYGIQVATYYTFKPMDANKPNGGEGYMSFYRWKGDHAELLPQAKTWRLMSVSLALGKGKSQVYETSYKDKDINAAGFTNVKGQRGAVLVNKGTVGKLVNVSFRNLGNPKRLTVEEYLADPDHDGGTSIRKEYVDEPGDTLNFTMYVPAQSVVGVLLSDTSKLQEILKLLFK